MALEHFTRELGAFVGNYKMRSRSFNIDAVDKDRSVIAETRYRALIQMGNLLRKMHAAWWKVRLSREAKLRVGHILVDRRYQHY